MPVRFPHVNKGNKYARDVVSKKIAVGIFVFLAAKKHLDELKKEKTSRFPYRFDRGKGEKICKFAEMLTHVKGKWAGSRIILEPWQCFVLMVAFGWVRKKDGLRRFREFILAVPRKNGKSLIAAVIALYLFVVDGEPGAEVYASAGSEEQAHEVFRPAWLMARNSPGFLKRFGVELGGTEKNPGNIYSLKSASRLEPTIGKPADGSSPHGWFQDEYHEAKTSEAYDTGKTGMGARDEPMMVVPSTAGTNTSYPFYSLIQKLKDLLLGKKVNDEIFGVYYTIDKDDDWTDFENWKKCNPNMGVSVREDFLRGQLKTALQESRKQNIIKCKHLNIFSNAGESWLNMVEWEKAGNPELDIRDFWGDPAYVGLDLASKIDVASMMPLFIRDGHYYLFSYHYIPTEKTKGEDNTNYAGWVHDKDMTATLGARIDFDYIKNDIREIARNHDLSGEENGGGEICNDPWNAQQLITELINENIECVEVPQTTAHISEPMKEIEAALKDGKFHHDGNPVTAWMFANVMCHEDKKGNIFPFKEGEKNKIDGAVATITAMNRAMILKDETGRSRYEDDDEDVFAL